MGRRLLLACVLFAAARPVGAETMGERMATLRRERAAKPKPLSVAERMAEDRAKLAKPAAEPGGTIFDAIEADDAEVRAPPLPPQGFL